MPAHRIYKEKTKFNVSTKLTPKQRSDLAAYCKAHGTTVSQLIRELLLEKIEHRE